MKRSLEIMDTTLRDGEQTSGVSYSPKEKLTIAKLLLDELKIDRIEKQMEKTKSHVKRDLLNRHIDWYEEEIVKMDEAIEVITQKYILVF